MAKTKIAIACQGGGSQTAFTAGALKALCDARIVEEFEIVSISGTIRRSRVFRAGVVRPREETSLLRVVA